MNGTTYTDFAALLRSIRRDSIVRIYRPFLLGGGTGSTRKQRAVWAERADVIKAKGGKLASIEPALWGHRLTMRAYEEIGNVARGKAGKTKPGRRRKNYTPEQWAALNKYWPRRHGVRVKDAVTMINKAIAPRKVTAGWLYQNVK